MSSWSKPMNMVGNVVTNVIHDPNIGQQVLGVALGHDMAKYVPVDLISDLPHYTWEVKKR